MNLERAIGVVEDTPCMVIDMDRTGENISEMQRLAESGNKKLRPHSKTHKIPEIASMQLRAGASGICVQKVSEAEAMFNGGIDQILVSNEIIDDRKIARLCQLILNGCTLSVAADSEYGLDRLDSAAKRAGITLPVMIDVNVGMDRCGVDIQEFRGFLDMLLERKSLEFNGVMAFDGQISSRSEQSRRKEVLREAGLLEHAFMELEKRGLEGCTFSVGGTPSAHSWSETRIATELQPGTYAYYDMHCLEMNLCASGDLSMGVVSQVMSGGNRKGRYILDSGYKSVSLDQGTYPAVQDGNGNSYRVLAMSEEHTVISDDSGDLKIGDRLVILPYHACTTTDFWDYALAFSGSGKAEMLRVAGRGRRE